MHNFVLHFIRSLRDQFDYFKIIFALSLSLTTSIWSDVHGGELDDWRVLPGLAPGGRDIGRGSRDELEQVLLVLLLQEHDAVLQEQDMQVDRLDATAVVRQLQDQAAVIDQPVPRQVHVLEAGEERYYRKSNKY